MRSTRDAQRRILWMTGEEWLEAYRRMRMRRNL